MTIHQEEMTRILDEVKEHWSGRRDTVRQLIRFLGVSQTEIAAALHMSRQTLQTRLKGLTKFEVWEIAAIAAGLGVPRRVMDMSPDAAVRWVMENIPTNERTPQRAAS